MSSIRRSLDFFNLVRKTYLYVLPVAFENQPVTYPANPVLVFTVVQSCIHLSGFVVFLSLEEKQAVVR